MMTGLVWSGLVWSGLVWCDNFLLAFTSTVFLDSGLASTVIPGLGPRGNINHIFLSHDRWLG
jgi:hypothetical protein